MSFFLKSNPVSAVNAYSENTERRRQTEEPNVKTTEHSGIWDKDRMFRMAGFQFKQMWKESLEARYFCRWDCDTSMKWKRMTTSFWPEIRPVEIFNVAETEDRQIRFLCTAIHVLIVEWIYTVHT